MPVNGIHTGQPAVASQAAPPVVLDAQLTADLNNQPQNNTSLILTRDLELGISRDPSIVLAEAQRAAQALRDVITGKDRPVRFNGEQYLEFEDWQTVARFYGLTAKVRTTAFVEYGSAQGFEATADVLCVATGQVISTAESMCLNDEGNWRKKPLFQLRSMAQTRACAKALRNVLSWVVVLAGYRPTPAEELLNVTSSDRGTDIDTGGAPYGTKEAAQNVAQRKIREMRKEPQPPSSAKPWKSPGEFRALCELLRERVGEVRFNEELELAGVTRAQDFIDRKDPEGALAFYTRVNKIAERAC